jgi:hypothetical protein
MDRLLRLLRSLGSDGATANAHQLLLERQRDDVAVRTLVGRLEAAAATPHAA